MYITSESLQKRIQELSNSIFEATNGTVIFEEFITIPYFNNIIVRFNLDEEQYTIEDIDRYENTMYEIVKDEFMIDFMGEVYKKVGLNMNELDSIFEKCNQKLANDEFIVSPHNEEIQKDVQYLLGLCDLPLNTPVWEIQLEEELALFILGNEFSQLGKVSAKDYSINIFQVKYEQCYGLMKAAMYAKSNHLSLIHVLLDIQKMN